MKNTPFIAILLAVLLGSASMAQPGQIQRKEWKEKLNLTADQEKSVKEIKTKVAKDLIDLRSQVQKKRIDLREAATADSPDRAKVEKLMKEIADAQIQQKMLLFDTDQKILGLLKPEQKKVYQEIKDARREGMQRRFMGQRGGKGMGMRGGPGRPPAGGKPPVDDDD
jgi:Spy/CpxP family protein refolding chaperone